MSTDWPLPTDPFGVQHLPYAVASAPGFAPHVVARFGDSAIDLTALTTAEGHPEHPEWAAAWATPSLNAFLDLGRAQWESARAWLQSTLSAPEAPTRVRQYLHPLTELELHLPVEVADYVDFYASETHATNVGRIFRPSGEALTPNWKHLPIGYHGRAGTIVPSGTDIVRPRGQRLPQPGAAPVFGPSGKLDLECEVAFIVGGSTTVGTPVSIEDAEDHLFGIALFNDWSARDLQAWEYVPLGPFLGKSFASSMAAWVTPLAALESAKIPLPQQDPAPLPYLSGNLTGFALDLSVSINGCEISQPAYAQLYWSPAQMLAHLTVNGASLRSGDVFASGTVSGSKPGQFGSLLELSWNGERPISLADNETRTFLQDGDVVTITGRAPGSDHAILTLGEVTGQICPALD